MKRSQREAAARGSTHLSRLSLPAVRSNGSFEGSDILAEAGAVPAILLCQVYRGVMAWALTPAAEHAGLFPPGAAAETRRLMREAPLPEELRPALETVCGLFDDPAGTDPRVVAEACVRIGEWAERKGDAPATALCFAQVAASCMPNDAPMAYRAGYTARRQATWDLAELWFRHSSTVSRRTRDWRSHATSYLALGNNFYYQGRYAQARREHLKALRVSKRHGLRELQAKAYHDLLAIAVVTNDAESADALAQRAFRAYGPHHENVPTLAHDIALFWHAAGQYARALRVFQALLPHFSQPERRLMLLGSIGREAGECGARETFAEVWQEVWHLAPTLQGVSGLSPTMVQLAQGALRLEEWTFAERAARYALQVAKSRGEADAVAAAEELLDMIESRSVVATTPWTPYSGNRGDAEFLADELVSTLESAAANL
ncbi:MAG: tetratricopeptide repeat protein [Gemmatimonadota bacterium]